MDPKWFYYYLITGAVFWNIAFPFLFKKKKTSEVFLFATYMIGNIVCAFLWFFILLSFIIKSTANISKDIHIPNSPKDLIPNSHYPKNIDKSHYVYNKKKQKIKIS